jgi:hypothetical protein
MLLMAIADNSGWLKNCGADVNLAMKQNFTPDLTLAIFTVRLRFKFSSAD